jgi:hypothetical protein
MENSARNMESALAQMPNCTTGWGLKRTDSTARSIVQVISPQLAPQTPQLSVQGDAP